MIYDHSLEIVRVDDGGVLSGRTFDRCLILTGHSTTIMDCQIDGCDIRGETGLQLGVLKGFGFKLDPDAAKLLGPQARAEGAIHYRDDLE